MTETPSGVGGIADLRPIARRREQRAWYWYDWANSAYVTTVTTVLFAPYLIAIAREAAVDNRIDVLGLSVAPGALPSFIITFSTLLSAVVLPPVGALADRTARKKEMLAGFNLIEAADMDEAVRRARSMALPGDAVLLSPACSSFDWFTSYAERGDRFVAAVERLRAGRDS